MLSVAGRRWRVRLHTAHHGVMLEGKALLQLKRRVAVHPGKPWEGAAMQTDPHGQSCTTVLQCCEYHGATKAMVGAAAPRPHRGNYERSNTGAPSQDAPTKQPTAP